MNHPNYQLIEDFYGAFARHDAEAMVRLYHDDVRFTDPAFGTLLGEEVRDMWRMLVERGRDSLTIRCRAISASDTEGTARWTADYIFSSTGRSVHNEISASFRFKDGKIIQHTDRFSFWKWSRQALGTAGLLLGWTPLLQNKVRAQARKSLTKYTHSRRAS